MTDTQNVETITVDAKLLAGLLADILLFTSKDETLQLQQGMVHGGLVLVARATDRYALAEAYIPINDGKWDETSILVPNAVVKQLIAVAKSGMFVQLGKTDTQLIADNFSSQATVRLSDDKFPRCAQLWEGTAAEPESVCCFEASALARPSAVAKRRKSFIRLHINRRGTVLATIDDNFRAVIMKSHNQLGDEVLYRTPDNLTWR